MGDMGLHKFFFLPELGSAHAHEVDLIIYLTHGLMFILLLGWGAFFIFTLVRFNRRMHPKADYKGAQSHVSTSLELIVAVIEIVLLIGFSLPFWNKQVNAYPNRPDKVEVRVIAEQFAWNIHYPGTDGVFGRTAPEFINTQSNPVGLDPDDPHGKDDITTVNQLHLPIGRTAYIHLTSKDVIHSFALPIMRVKQDAIPGMSIPLWFTPTKTGQSEIACAQLCGLGHYRMRGFLTVHTQEDFQTWIDEQSVSSGDDDEEYDDFWN